MTKTLFMLLVVGLAFGGSAGEIFAQEDLGEDAPATGPAFDLSLRQALSAALGANFDLVQAKLDPRIAGERVTVADAFFDPELQVQPTYSAFRREPAQVFEAAGEGDTFSVSTSFNDRFKFGGDYTVGFDTSRQTGDAVNFSPYYESSLFGIFNMPLLRGRGSDATLEALLIARGNLDVSREDLEIRVQALLQSVEVAYWDLVAAREALNVARQSLERAQDLLGLNRKKVEVGTLAPIEITQAEAGVASQEEGVIVAETTLENAEDELLRLMAVGEDSPMWSGHPVPEELPPFQLPTPDLEAAMATAVQERPELSAARRRLDNARISERAAHNAVKPGLDLSLRYFPRGNNNNGGFVVPGPDGIPDTLDDQFVFDVGSYTDSVSEIVDNENYDYQGQLTFSMPIRNRAAKANYRIAGLNLEKAELAVAGEEQDIRVEVRRAVREVNSSAQRVAAARANVELQRKKLEAEQKKFENGMSTSFEVLTFQNDLAEAQLSEIRALTDYQKALVALELAQGSLLAARGLALEADPPQ